MKKHKVLVGYAVSLDSLIIFWLIMTVFGIKAENITPPDSSSSFTNIYWVESVTNGVYSSPSNKISTNGIASIAFTSSVTPGASNVLFQQKPNGIIISQNIGTNTTATVPIQMPWQPPIVIVNAGPFILETTTDLVHWTGVCTQWITYSTFGSNSGQWFRAAWRDQNLKLNVNSNYNFP